MHLEMHLKKSYLGLKNIFMNVQRRLYFIIQQIIVFGALSSLLLPISSLLLGAALVRRACILEGSVANKIHFFLRGWGTYYKEVLV